LALASLECSQIGLAWSRGQAARTQDDNDADRFRKAEKPPRIMRLLVGLGEQVVEKPR
jgi:hypothetical protein